MNLLWDMVIDGAAVVQAALARYSISLFGLTSFWSLSLKALGRKNQEQGTHWPEQSFFCLGKSQYDPRGIARQMLRRTENSGVVRANKQAIAAAHL
jgi:hypothetical protein